MDQSINAALAQCATLYKQLYLAQRVVVPMTLEYNFQGPDSYDPTFIDTVSVTAKGELLYVPFHTVSFDVPIGGIERFMPILAFIPDTLSATVQGQGEAQGPGHGGDFRVPAIDVAISGALPLATSTATVAVKSTVNLLCNFSSPFNETTLPIKLTQSDAKGDSSNVVLHLGTPVIVLGPLSFGPISVRVA